jgi:hypothetical protein
VNGRGGDSGRVLVVIGGKIVFVGIDCICVIILCIVSTSRHFQANFAAERQVEVIIFSQSTLTRLQLFSWLAILTTLAI